MIAYLLFWFCVLALFHSYVLYPVLLKLFSLGKKENEIVFALDDVQLPEVFIVFSVYNEEKVIREKLESIFDTTYPLSKLKVYIGSDNSTDKTNSIVEEFVINHPQLKFIPFSERNGKSNVLNKLVSRIEEEEIDKVKNVFIFTDANVMFTRDTIFEMVKHFKNNTISLVGATILNKGVKKDGISFQEKSYIGMENTIKHLEGLNWGCMTGAFGACYALRADSWKEIPQNYLMEDFYLSMNVLEQRKKTILDMKAVCYEDVSNEIAEEFKRKSRIQAGNFQNFAAYWKLLFRFDAAAFCFFSHKVIRWLGPMFIVLAYISNLFLLPNSQFYRFVFVVQNLLLLSPVIDWLLKRIGIHLILLRFASYFIIMNIALANGFVMYAKGIKTNTWNPTKRNIE